MHLKNTIYFILLCFITTPVISQNKIEFKQLEGENVSTQSITYAIAKDSIGNLWIASEEGVLKHNSKFYQIYNTYNGLPEELNNWASEIFIDSKQNIWIGLEKGVCKYNKNLDVFEIVPSNEDINPSLVNSIIEDNNHNIWVGAFNGLWRLNNNSSNNKLVRVDNSQYIQDLEVYKGHVVFGTSRGLFTHNISSNNTNHINLNEDINIKTVKLIDSVIYIGTNNGNLFKLHKNLASAEKIEFKNHLTLPITDIVKNESNNFFVSTDGDGLFEFSKDFSIVNHWNKDDNNPYSISSSGIYDILLDKEHILWLATYGGGISYLDFNRLPFKNIKHLFNDKNSLIANFTRSIAEDSKGNLWFGSKKGISIWKKQTNKWEHIPNMEPNKTNIDDIVLALEPDGDYMWVGTYNNGVFKININTLQRTHLNKLHKNLIKKVYTIKKDYKGNIWVGGIDDNLAVISKNNSINFYPVQQIKSIYQTKSGNILAAGRFGVYKIKPDSGEFEIIEDLKPNASTLTYTTINNITENSNGDLILATNGGGIVFYNPKNRNVKSLTLYSGMPSDIAHAIILQSNSSIWASTSRGLVNIKLAEKDTIINIFDKKDGLASTEFNYGSYCKINDSLFAFGGIDGVSLFNPYLIKENNFAPKLVFDEFKLFNKKISPGEKPLKKHINQSKKVLLKHNENSIEIVFTGILHSGSSKIKYSYKLEGFDNDWSKAQTPNQATYTNLPPGDYTFKVKAFNKFGTPSKERTFQIVIISPWWATNQAYFFYALITLLIVYAIIHFTSAMMKKKHADEQINFFNNITHEIKTPLTILISSLDNLTEQQAGTESKQRIKTTVKRINSLFEQMLNFQKVTSENNAALDISEFKIEDLLKKRINNFMPLTQERNLKIILNNNWPEAYFYFDKDILDKIILNLVSNAIKYSFENSKIHINLSKTIKHELKIEIIDHGVGIPKDQQKYILKRYYRARNVINSQLPGTGLGLMMVKKLLEKTGGSIDFESIENKGTTFTVIVKNLKFEYEKNIKQSEETAINNNTEDIEEQPEINDFSNSKILIVEDNDELRHVLIDTLGKYFQIYDARNGKEGLEIAYQIFPDIILTDLIMPEMDGMEMAKKLKADINLNHIPVFMLTVLQSTTQKLKSIESGISEYIEKPIDIKFLLAKMVNTLKWQKKLREKYIHDSETENAALFRDENNQKFLKDLEKTILDNIENNDFSVHDLSSSFNMSRTSLYMKLKNLVDLSPQDFIIHTKLKHAKKLLIEGKFTIKEVAYRSGFSNPKYFSTSFKKFYGTSPSAYLDHLQEIQDSQ